MFKSPVFVGDTITAVTTVVSARLTSKPGRESWSSGSMSSTRRSVRADGRLRHADRGAARVTVVIRQRTAPSLVDVSAEGQAAFTSARAALEADDAVVLIVREPDLAGAGLHRGRRGRVRPPRTYENPRHRGWRERLHINLVAVDRNPEPGADLLEAAASVRHSTGRCSTRAPARSERWSRELRRAPRLRRRDRCRRRVGIPIASRLTCCRRSPSEGGPARTRTESSRRRYSS